MTEVTKISRIASIRMLVSTRRALLREMRRASQPLTWGLIAAIVFFALIGGIFTMASGILVGQIPTVIQHGLHSPAGHALVFWGIVAGVIYAIQGVGGPLRGALSDMLGRRLEGRLRGRVMRAVLGPAGVAHLERPDVADKVSLAQTVGIGEIRPRAAVQAISDKYSSQLSGFVAAAWLALWRWYTPFVFVAGWLFLRYAWTRKLRDSVQLTALQTRSLRRSSYFRDLALTAPAAKETRIFGLDSWLVGRFSNDWRNAMTVVWRSRKQGGPLLWVSVGILAAIHLWGFFALGTAAFDHHLSLTELAITVLAIMGISGVANADLDHKIDAGSRPALATGDLEREIVKPEYVMPGTRPAAGLPARCIRFEDVHFRYPGQAAEVFSGLDLEIPVGRSLAIVGENGAGKTTLIKLLARLYDPEAGAVTVDGTDLRELDPRQWARRVAAIFQDFMKYGLTVTDNIGFGSLGLAADKAALTRVARQAGAAKLIDELPRGWDTVLSREFKDGSDLSGGQWQRVALARALLAVEGGAGVLVLDEPTAHLDARAEAEFFDRFLELTEGKTTIVISHRFSTVRRADRIVVLEHGRLAEQGTHDELVAAGGRYARMFAVQAARFAQVSSVAGDVTGGDDA
jgi:ATP-binding cassette, subfamily B, bacterial